MDANAVVWAGGPKKSDSVMAGSSGAYCASTAAAMACSRAEEYPGDVPEVTHLGQRLQAGRLDRIAALIGGGPAVGLVQAGSERVAHGQALDDEGVFDRGQDLELVEHGVGERCGTWIIR